MFLPLKTTKQWNLDSGVKQTRVVAELLQCSDAGQMCVSLRGALQASSEDSMREEMHVQLSLQQGLVAEQRPLETWRKVAVDYLLRPP